jgi:hypothetical protein
MHVDVSFSYLRSAATASFDIKKFHRNCTAAHVLKLSLTTEKTSKEGDCRYGVSWYQHRYTVGAVLYKRYPYKTSVLERSGLKRSGDKWSGFERSGVLKVRHRKVPLYGTLQTVVLLGYPVQSAIVRLKYVS